MPTAAQPQTSIYETTIENADLEAALERREQAKAKAGAARGEFKQADDHAKALIENLDLGDDAPVRVGGFVITRRQVPGGVVSFEKNASTRTYIRPIGEEQ